MAQRLEYKLKLNGLPKRKEVSAAYTSQTCPECGSCHKDNRKKDPLPNGKVFKLDKFLCLNCNYQCDADLNAARVIALKKLWRESLSESKRAKLFKDLDNTEDSFACFLKRLAKKRKME